ncbi:MAG: two-component system response regulator [Nitrospiraceae bacterium]
MASTLFVIDSSPAVRRMIEQLSSDQGYEVYSFLDGPAALEAARKMPPKAVIADYHLNKITFSSFCKELNKLDNLTDTPIISLIDSADHPDEGLYRSLGVAVFLTKPLQPGNLLETLRALDTAGQPAVKKGKARRTWPPTSQATDLEEGESPIEAGEELNFSFEPVKSSGESVPTPSDVPPTPRLQADQGTPGQPRPLSHIQPADARSSEPPSSSRPPVAPPHLELASKTFFDAMASGVARQVTESLTASVQSLVSREVERQVNEKVQDAVRTHLAETLSPDALTGSIEPIVRHELPSLVSQQISSHLVSLEPTVLHRMEETTRPAIESAVQAAVEQATVNAIEPAVQKVLPDAVHRQLGDLDHVVTSTIQEMVGSLMRDVLERVARDIAQTRIEQAVQEIVPAVAETQVSEEIKRLSALE